MRPGRLLLAQMRPDTAEAVAWRLRDNEIRARALAEREVEFPTLTTENAREAIAWQDARIAELHLAAQAALAKAVPQQ